MNKDIKNMVSNQKIQTRTILKSMGLKETAHNVFKTDEMEEQSRDEQNVAKFENIPEEMMDRADYERNIQKDEIAERHFRNIDMLKEIRKDTPLREFAEAIREVLKPEEIRILVAHLRSSRRIGGTL